MKDSRLPDARWWLAPLMLFGLALALRLGVIIWWQFDGLYGQDAFAYFQQAVAIAQNIPHGQPPPTDFFWPSGYPLLAASLMGLLGQQPLAAQLITILSGAALAPLSYLLCRDLFAAAGRIAGIVAGITMALAGQPLQSSVVIMADIPGVFWLLLSAWLLVLAAHRPRPGLWLFTVGICFGLAAISRWPSVLAAPGFIAYALWQVRLGRLHWRHLLWPVLGSLLIVLPQLWLSAHRIEGLLHPWLMEWRLANALRSEFNLIDGHFRYRLPMALFYAQTAAHPAYLFPLFSLAALWASWRLAKQRNWPALALLGGWVIPVYIFLAGIPFQNFRFGLTFYPPVVALAGFGVADLWARGRWLLAGLIAAWLGMLFWAYRTVSPFLSAQTLSQRVANEVALALPPDSHLLSFGLTSTLQHYTDLNTEEFFLETPASLAARLEQDETWYLLVEPDDLESQWAGKQPQINYQWLRQHSCLRQIGRFQSYILFDVRAGGC